MEVPDHVDDVRKSTKDYILKHYGGYGALLVVAAALLVVWSGDPRLLLGPAAIAAAGYWYVYVKVRSEFIKEFGSSIGYTYAPAADPQTAKGKLFELGHSRKIRDVLNGVHGGRPARIFSYRFTIGYGKGAHTYSFSVFEVVFGKEMPEILLKTLAAGRSTPYQFGEGESLRLEGDFNEHFSLHVPKGYEMDAYEIFTPDVMAALIDKAGDLNFEFSGDRLYIYTPRAVNTKTDMQKLFDLVDYLADIFGRNLSASAGPEGAETEAVANRRLSGNP